MTSVAERLVSAQEFASLPRPREGGKLELVRGNVVCMASVGPDHGDTASDIDFALKGFVRTNQIGRVRVETGYWLERDPDTQRGPDVSFITNEQVARESVWHGASDQVPTLAVEVVSPNDTDRAVAEKVEEYLRAGVQRVWVVRIELLTVTVHRPGGDAHTYHVGDTLSSDDASFQVDGFALPLAALFAK
jgi:Uma2 family endonuclease